MRRAIALLFVGNAVALRHQIGGRGSYSKTTTAASPVQIEMVQSIHDNAPPWHATAVDEEEISLSKNDLVVASPASLIDGESGYYLHRTAETIPMSTYSGYIIEIRSDDEAGGATLFPRQVDSSVSGASSTDGPMVLESASDLRGPEATPTNDAPETSTAAPEVSTDSESTSNLPSIASSAATFLQPGQSSNDTRIAPQTSPAPTSASPPSQPASASASQSEEAPAGSTTASLSLNSETAVPPSDVEPAVSSPGDQSGSPAAPSTIAIRTSATLTPFEITPPVIAIPGTTLTRNSDTQFVADNQTLIPVGSAISISGTTVSLDPSATEIVVGGTSTISVIPTTVYRAQQPPTISLAGTTITRNSASEYVAGTQTLMPGGPVITILGTAVSLDPSATAVVVSEIRTDGRASGFITRGPGGTLARNTTATATTIVEGYTGVASNNKVGGFGWWIFAILVVVNMFMNY